MIGDMNQERLQHAKKVGFEPIDLTKSDKLEYLIAQVVGVPEVDAAIDCVGFEAHGHGSEHGTEAPATVLNSLMTITRAAGSIGIPGLYVTEDPGAKDEASQKGNLRMRFGLGWAKSQRFFTGQTPVLKYNRQLMHAILHDRLPIAKSSTQLSSSWTMRRRATRTLTRERQRNLLSILTECWARLLDPTIQGGTGKRIALVCSTKNQVVKIMHVGCRPACIDL